MIINPTDMEGNSKIKITPRTPAPSPAPSPTLKDPLERPPLFRIKAKKSNYDQLLAQLLQRGKIHGRVVDERARFSVGGDFSPYDGEFVFIQIIFFKKRFQSVAAHIEGCLHHAFFAFIPQRF